MSEEVQTPVPEDHPMMRSWNEYKATESYKNTRKWALDDRHVDGSLWAAFLAGYQEGSGNDGSD